jgi:hypothetical protein
VFDFAIHVDADPACTNCELGHKLAGWVCQACDGALLCSVCDTAIHTVRAHRDHVRVPYQHPSPPVRSMFGLIVVRFCVILSSSFHMLSLFSNRKFS